MIAIITGSNGFSGKHLITYLTNHKLVEEIVGIDTANKTNNIKIEKYFSLNRFNDFKKYVCTINNEVRFFHLGGILKANTLDKFINANVYWTSKYLDILKNIKRLISFINVGSSAEYGIQVNPKVKETNIPKPINYYGISKHLQNSLCLEFQKITSLKVVCTRTFNLIGPGLSDKFVVGKLVTEFSKVKDGIFDTIQIGQINTSRDFIDIRDAVKYYWELSEKGIGGEIYNVGSGSAIKINDIIKLLNKLCEVDAKIETSKKDNLFEVKYQQADLKKIEDLGLNIKMIPIRQSIIDMLNFYRNFEK